ALRGEICLWDAATGKLIREIKLPQEDGVSCLSFSPDSKKLVAGTWEAAYVLNVATGKQFAVLKGHDGYLRQARFQKDGNTLLTADGWQTPLNNVRCSVRLWNLDTGKQLRVWTPPKQTPAPAKNGATKEDCHLVDLSVNGGLIVWGCARGKVGEKMSATLE